jgi:hypothetical protein
VDSGLLVETFQSNGLAEAKFLSTGVPTGEARSALLLVSTAQRCRTRCSCRGFEQRRAAAWEIRLFVEVQRQAMGSYSSSTFPDAASTLVVAER